MFTMCHDLFYVCIEDYRCNAHVWIFFPDYFTSASHLKGMCLVLYLNVYLLHHQMLHLTREVMYTDLTLKWMECHPAIFDECIMTLVQTLQINSFAIIKNYLPNRAETLLPSIFPSGQQNVIVMRKYSHACL